MTDQELLDWYALHNDNIIEVSFYDTKTSIAVEDFIRLIKLIK